MSEPAQNNITEISPQIREQMQAICSQALSHRDDAGRIRDELYGHLEDKLFAYLRGEERLTEADAMILVREHFGRPEVLRAMLGEVHRAERAIHQPPLARKLLALCLITAVIEFCMFVVNSVSPVLFMSLAGQNREVQFSTLAIWNVSVSTMLAGVAVYATYLFIRKNDGRDGLADRGWVMRWHPATIVAAIISIATMRFVLIAIGSNFTSSTHIVGAGSSSMPFILYYVAINWAGFLLVVIRCALWLKWASSGVIEVWRPATAAAITWALYHLSFRVISMLIHHVLFPSNAMRYSMWMLPEFLIAALAFFCFAGWNAYKQFRNRVRVRYA